MMRYVAAFRSLKENLPSLPTVTALGAGGRLGTAVVTGGGCGSGGPVVPRNTPPTPPVINPPLIRPPPRPPAGSSVMVTSPPGTGSPLPYSKRLHRLFLWRVLEEGRTRGPAKRMSWQAFLPYILYQLP